MKVWLWGWHTRLKGEPSVVFDEERSGFAHWRLKQVGEAMDIPDRTFLQVSAAIAKVKEYRVLPYTDVAIVRDEALAIFERLPPGEVDFHKVTVICKDAETDSFTLVRPKRDCACTDIGRSEIEWTRPNEFYTRWRRLEFLGGCMGSCSIAREKFSRWMILSDLLKAKLETADPKGIGFILANGSRFGL